MSRLSRFTVATIGVNLLVILWGAWVRASGSGAGCGNRWPLCGDTLIPQAPTAHTLTELAHRLSSGIALLMVIWMVILSRRQFPAKHSARRWAIISLVFILLEALIGAALVKFEYVASNASLGRAIWLGTHLFNTQLMLGAFWMTWWSAEDRPVPSARILGARPWYLVGLFALLLTGMAGAIASLGTTLFPSASLAEGVAQDFAATAHFLVRLRVIHPIVAVSAGLLWLMLARMAPVHADDAAHVRHAARVVLGMVALQWLIGVATLLLNAPVPAQMVHLLSADILWLCCVHLTLTMAQIGRTIPASRRAASTSNTFPSPVSR